MDKRLGIVAIIVKDRSSTARLNTVLGEHAGLITARLGLPLRDKGISLISLVVDGDTDELGALTGKIGRLPGIQVSSVLTKHREDYHAELDQTGDEIILH